MFRKLLKLLGFLFLVIFIIGTLSFTARIGKDAVCRNIEVEFRNADDIHVNKDEIVRMVKSADTRLMEKKLYEINAELIEKEVEKHQAILKADVYKVIAKDSTSFKGILAVKVKHRKPIVRVMSTSGSYYLDKYGDKIPLSSNYAANVIVTTGYFDESYAKEILLPFIFFVENDAFWKAQIEQVHIEKNGDVILTPLVGDHFIELGKLDNYEVKLRNMRSFYKQVLAKNNWINYKSVNLKYKDQVIAKRR